MKSPRFLVPSLPSVLILTLCVPLALKANEERSQKSKEEVAPILSSASDRLLPSRRKTAKEKEYAELARKIRESDQAFDQSWRSAKPEERQKLRKERLEKLQPTLLRMNQLAFELRKERPALNGETAPAPVPVSGALAGPDEVKGKTVRELQQMGIAVDALHQKAFPSHAAAGETKITNNR